jgi:hypothetical protein
MTNVSARILALSFSWVVLSAPLLSAQDLSQYREFQLGMSLATAAQTREADSRTHLAAATRYRHVTASRLGPEGHSEFLRRPAVSNHGQL